MSEEPSGKQMRNSLFGSASMPRVFAIAKDNSFEIELFKVLVHSRGSSS
jgi:hypothetical protein